MVRWVRQWLAGQQVGRALLYSMVGDPGWLSSERRSSGRGRAGRMLAGSLRALFRVLSSRASELPATRQGLARKCCGKSSRRKACDSLPSEIPRYSTRRFPEAERRCCVVAEGRGETRRIKIDSTGLSDPRRFQMSGSSVARLRGRGVSDGWAWLPVKRPSRVLTHFPVLLFFCFWLSRSGRLGPVFLLSLETPAGLLFSLFYSSGIGTKYWRELEEARFLQL